MLQRRDRVPVADRGQGCGAGPRRPGTPHDRSTRCRRFAESWAERVPEMGDPELDRFMAELAAAMDDRVPPHRRARRPDQPAVGVQALGDAARRPGSNGAMGGRAPPGWAPTGSCTATKRARRRDRPRAREEPRPRPRRGLARRVRGARPRRRHRPARLHRRPAQAAARDVRAGDRLGAAAMWGRNCGWPGCRPAPPWRTRSARTTSPRRRRRRAPPAARAARRDVARDAGQGHRVADLLGEAQETRRQWEALTEPTRRVAIAADLELRRRHPGIGPGTAEVRRARRDHSCPGSCRAARGGMGPAHARRHRAPCSHGRQDSGAGRREYATHSGPARSAWPAGARPYS